MPGLFFTVWEFHRICRDLFNNSTIIAFGVGNRLLGKAIPSYY